MTHRFPIKEIARQAALGTATVDRVLNGRPNVSPQTRNRVLAAIGELEAQETQLSARGRRICLDVVAEAPTRFTDEIRAAAQAALASVAGAVIRVRFTLRETMTEAELVAILDRIRKRGSHGVCLKARDIPAVRDAVAGLVAARIPVFTLVTDLPGSGRQGYFGLDNDRAGRTAAYLLAGSLRCDKTGAVLTSRSQDSFAGEAERLQGFLKVFTTLCPGVRVIDLAGGAGMTAETRRRVSAQVASAGRISAVYSMGGGNAAILDALASERQRDFVYVAHDLDRENRRLLSDQAIGFVLHHDLEADMRSLYLTALQDNSGPDDAERRGSSEVQVITPYNIPLRR